jgi:hypothetical protein
METLFSENSEKIVNKFECKQCDYKCSLRQHFNQHCKSKKHLVNIVNKTVNTVNNIEEQYKCVCGKEYKSRVGLWKHRKICDNFMVLTKKISDDDNMVTMKDMLKVIMTNTNEYQSIIKELIKNGINTNTNNTNTNCHNINNINNTFNLQVYLNETCKNAMNLSDFIENIKPTIEELELTGREGYVKGISYIVNTRLNDVKTEEKPIQCTDGKREVLYIKENNIWNKEYEEKPLLTSAIKRVAHKNMCNILEWTKIYPDCTDSDSRKNDMYLNIVSNSMPGSTKEESDRNYEKIISNVAKKTIIDKVNFIED